LYLKKVSSKTWYHFVEPKVNMEEIVLL